jgi:uncharacterized protein
MAETSITERLAALPWTEIERQLWDRGYAHLPPLLTAAECAGLAALYDDDGLFRSRVDMARHRFGEGEYKYFGHPLPPLVQELRVHAYPPLAAVANRWMEALRSPERFPPTHADLQRLCAARGQARPTPLLLRYEAGGYNCLHQDVYGELTFPLQIAAFLSRPGVDYGGGEFVLVEQRPRAQSAAEVVVPAQGELVVFTTRHRPWAGRRGHSRAAVRHGVSRLRWGRRYTLGVIFHDAR